MDIDTENSKEELDLLEELEVCPSCGRELVIVNNKLKCNFCNICIDCG